jgi:hypothetical protein
MLGAAATTFGPSMPRRTAVQTLACCPRLDGRSRAGLDSKVAIVTGLASGLGATYARGLAPEGVAVVVADIDGEGALGP